MVIQVSQIREDEGLSLHHLYPTGEPQMSAEEGRLAGRTELKLLATRDREEVRLIGSLNATVEFACDRCLTTTSLPIEQDFDLLYLPVPASLLAEKELGDDDLSIAYYAGQTLDLDDLVREQIALALPMTKLCSESCKGLCPQCGVNWNFSECRCNTQDIDPRWAALKNLQSE